MDQFTSMFGRKTQARIRYGDADYQVLSPGEYVRCAVTGQAIPLTELRYWSVARQEPYADARASLTRHLGASPKRSDVIRFDQHDGLQRSNPSTRSN